ncbi:hypothetical protein EMIT0373P_60362 [Pseudomonas chlororaphis]
MSAPGLPIVHAFEPRGPRAPLSDVEVDHLKIHPAPAGLLDVVRRFDRRLTWHGATAEWRALSRCDWLVANIGYVSLSENGPFDRRKVSFGHY